MPLEYTKAMLAAGWMLAAILLGLVGGVTSAGAGLLLGVALLPPLAIFLFWHGQSQTMSESIQRVRK